MRTEKRPPFYLSAILLFFIMLNACEEDPDFIGRDLLPRGDDFTVLFNTQEVIHGYTRRGDSIKAAYKPTHIIGVITDPFFGRSSAALLTTVSTTTISGSFGPKAQPDSVFLYVDWQEVYGDGSQPFQLHVHEFTEFIRFDTSYYSNWDIAGKYGETPLGSTIISRDDSLARIHITDTAFIYKFLRAEDSILTDRQYLQELIYGLYYTVDDPGDAGTMVSINFDQGVNYLKFYYQNDTATGLVQEYSLDNNTNGRISMFSHDASGYALNDYLTNGSGNDSMMFVQSMAGVNARIRFPDLLHWRDSNVAINEARLIIPVADTNITLQTSRDYCETLELYTLMDDGSYVRTRDQWVDPGSIGGTYDDDENAYIFTVKVQLQSIIEKAEDNLELVLLPASSSETVKRVGLYGWNNQDPEKRMRLEITYTKL